jgi:uncharacterized protein YegJ (DUF2314 family)
MSESEPSRVFQFDGSDPSMQAAYRNARSTFRYFWRELSWEYRRIIPGLGLSAVKAPFSDDGRGEVEQMWLGEIDFDGESVHGVLLNAPNHLRSVKKGDSVTIPLGQISDWMYSIGDEVYGGYTVNLMRSRMKPRERREHDKAWGLNFGDPATIRVVPGHEGADDIPEHPMSENMAPGLRDQVVADPSFLTGTGHRGWTMLQGLALAGSYACVKVLLEAGADPNAAGDDGMTPLRLARSLGWDRVAQLLVSHGAK